VDCPACGHRYRVGPPQIQRRTSPRRALPPGERDPLLEKVWYYDASAADAEPAGDEDLFGKGEPLSIGAGTISALMSRGFPQEAPGDFGETEQPPTPAPPGAGEEVKAEPAAAPADGPPGRGETVNPWRLATLIFGAAALLLAGVAGWLAIRPIEDVERIAGGGNRQNDNVPPVIDPALPLVHAELLEPEAWEVFEEPRRLSPPASDRAWVAEQRLVRREGELICQGSVVTEHDLYIDQGWVHVTVQDEAGRTLGRTRVPIALVSRHDEYPFEIAVPASLEGDGRPRVACSVEIVAAFDRPMAGRGRPMAEVMPVQHRFRAGVQIAAHNPMDQPIARMTVLVIAVGEAGRPAARWRMRWNNAIRPGQRVRFQARTALRPGWHVRRWRVLAVGEGR